MKKLIFLLLACALLCGCAETNANDSTSTTTTTTANTTTTENTTTSSTTTTPQATTTTPETTTIVLGMKEPIDSELYSEQLRIAKEVNEKAEQIHDTLLSSNFDLQVQYEVIDSSDNKSLGLQYDEAVYLLVTDERFDTWDEVMGALREAFSDKASELMFSHSPIRYEVVEEKVYALCAVGFPIQLYAQAESITEISEDKFTLTYGLYHEDEVLEDYCHYADCVITYTKIDGNWVIDEFSENMLDGKDFAFFFNCFEVLY